MAIERQPGLQAQAVTGAQADGSDPLVGEECIPDAQSRLAWHGDLVAVLAGVARARDDSVDPKGLESGRLHEGKLCRVRRMGRQHLGGLRSLQGQQRPVFQAVDSHLASQLGVDDLEVVFLAGAVDHHEQAVVIGPAGHQIVDDAALLVQKDRVTLLAGLQPDEVAGCHLFEGRQGRNAPQASLAHMGNVEQASAFPGPEMLFQHPIPVLHGHGIAGEGHHPGASLKMGGVQGRML